MIPLRFSSVFAIRTPRLYGSCVSRDRWFSTQMTFKILPTLSLQGKVSNSDDIVFLTQKQVLFETTGLSCDRGRSGTWE